MRLPVLLLLSILMFTLINCGQGSDDDVSDSVIIETQMETLEKAKNVEDVLKQADEQQRDSIDSY